MNKESIADIRAELKKAVGFNTNPDVNVQLSSIHEKISHLTRASFAICDALEKLMEEQDDKPSVL